MIGRSATLRRYPAVFLQMTGLRIPEFDDLLTDVLPRLTQAEQERLRRTDRQRAIGGGRSADLAARDQVLLTVVWLRQYPTNEVLGFLFGVSDSTASRVRMRILPLLEALGRDTMRLPAPGKKRRKTLDGLLAETPALAVIIDTFEQRVQRPRDTASQRAHYSGKQKQHTLKVQVAIDEDTGAVCDLSESYPGPTADLTILKESQLLERLPDGVGGIGDLGYLGIADLHPQGLGACPRRKPRRQERPPADGAFNRAFSQRRIRVEHTIGRIRRYQCVSHVDRHHRQHHGARTRAVAGLVNRQIYNRRPY
jgi:DDE superfamily endonuclease/Helix-turn-helix of DDE superfamily endonuclease